MEKLFQTIDAAMNWVTRPEILIGLSTLVLILMVMYPRTWTQPKWAMSVTIFGVALFFYSWFDWPGVSHQAFRDSVTKADNIPIVMIIGLLWFFMWLSFRKGSINDERADRGEPPLEAAEKSRKILVWPDLVYTELIAMVLCMVLLIVWSVLIKAPIEEPANAARTPNPSKAPWYFLGLQELLVYFDPWLAGVVVPGTIIIGLIAIPYVDRNPKGNGYYTIDERKMAIFIFLFGFLVLWVVQMFIGTFLRGPGWNFFGIYEDWTTHKTVPLRNVDVSEIFFVSMMGMKVEPEAWYIREIPGLLLLGFYFAVLPLIITKLWGMKLFRELGALRYGVVINLALFMGLTPLKMIARWLFNLKYFVNIDEILLNV